MTPGKNKPLYTNAARESGRRRLTEEEEKEKGLSEEEKDKGLLEEEEK